MNSASVSVLNINLIANYTISFALENNILLLVISLRYYQCFTNILKYVYRVTKYINGYKMSCFSSFQIPRLTHFAFSTKNPQKVLYRMSTWPERPSLDKARPKLLRPKRPLPKRSAAAIIVFSRR